MYANHKIRLFLQSIRYRLSLFSVNLNRKYTNNYDIEPGYRPQNVEFRQKRNVLQVPKNNSSNNNFSMILPPPNVTGYIHLGHCLTATVQDVVARYKRKQNLNVEWIPGMDHAGIATQIVVEKVLQKEKKMTRHDLGRTKFLEEVHNWKQLRSTRTKEDLLKLGTTLDWEKEYFTMDEFHSYAVREAFIRLFEKGLVYRSKSLVNWSCFLESAISDIEIDNMEINGPTEVFVPGYKNNVKFGQIYNIVYKTVSGENIIVSTTRPETILGDVAVAVNPKDTRYCRFLEQEGLKLVHPFRQDTIPLIADDSVDPDFGTGAVKITPGHDNNDFLMAQRHNLKMISIMDEKGAITKGFGVFSGLPRFTARKMILNALEDKGLLSEVKPHKMILPICSRSKDIIELQLRPQWFVRCKEMSEKALAAVKSGKIKMHPNNFLQEWENWLINCRDWCISRQLWWGHQIPAWQSVCGNSWVAAHTKDEALNKIQQAVHDLKRDEDVLDTWFSSALLPLALHGWPTSPLSNFFPLKLMETGHDILFFWVARMVMLSIELTGNVPFHEILLHGIICDAQGRKMSKSLGNVITPDQIINGISLEKLQQEAQLSFDSGILTKQEYEKSLKGQRKMFPNGIPECGTDALRFTLCSHNIKSHFMNFDIQEVYTNRLFFNKIWQATRYTIGLANKINYNLKSLKINECEFQDNKLSLMDKWILSRLSETSSIVKNSLETYNFHFGTTALKLFFYSNFCDTYLETTKKRQIEKRTHETEICCKVLAVCLSEGLELMEVFTPFLSKDLKNVLPICELKDLEKYRNLLLEKDVKQILNVCAAIRQHKSQHNITKKHKPALFIHPSNSTSEQLLKSYQDEIETLTFSTELTIVPEFELFSKQNYNLQSTAGILCSYGIITENHIDFQAISKNINRKKITKLEQQLQKTMKIVTTQGYKESASAENQIKLHNRIKNLQMEIEKLRAI